MARNAPVERISRSDRERLCSAAGRKEIDLTRSLLGPDTLTWHINREAVLLAGGGCALLMQVAHPLVAAGVADHSNFQERPLDRLYRTLDLMLTITFAPAADAIRAVREIERRHAKVRGRLAVQAGPFAVGTPYRASDPALMLWVHATLVHTAERIFGMFVRPLAQEEQEKYYEESKVIARLLGIPSAAIPPTWSKFESYMQEMLAGDVLTVTAQARAIASAILQPTQPIWLRGAMPPVRLLSVGLLPEVLRQRYGFAWSSWQEQLFRAAVMAGQLALPWLPGFARYFPHARQGWQREYDAGFPRRAVRSRAAMA
ncbi:MAG: DUF2236 domain-containing protein [Candidatus Binatia bacterium]|nr:DUF2236 domain-containing protein [Candidatus Binatia bacterium]